MLNTRNTKVPLKFHTPPYLGPIHVESTTTRPIERAKEFGVSQLPNGRFYVLVQRKKVYFRTLQKTRGCYFCDKSRHLTEIVRLGESYGLPYPAFIKLANQAIRPETTTGE